MSAAAPQPLVPHPGAQWDFIACPFDEALLHGPRGRGGTMALLLDFLADVGPRRSLDAAGTTEQGAGLGRAGWGRAGWGSAWTGTLFRTSYKSLKHIIRKSREVVPTVFPDARYNQTEFEWTFATGEALYLRYCRTPEDYGQYHGWELAWIGFDELTAWPTLEVYELLKGNLRSPEPGVPLRIRSNSNPWGRGFASVKKYFRLGSVPDRQPFLGEDGATRVTVYGHRHENTTLMAADPRYDRKMTTLADPSLRKAWGIGDPDWSAPVGGYFHAVWYAHGADGMTEPLVLPRFTPPRTWTVYRFGDYGSSAPAWWGWGVITNGEAILLPTHEHSGTDHGPGWEFCPPAGSRIVLAEWYLHDAQRHNRGVNMPSYEIARGILEREWAMGPELALHIQPGPADGLWGRQASEEETLQAKMLRVASPIPEDPRVGVQFSVPIKGPGSRVRGWQAMVDMLAAAQEFMAPEVEPGEATRTAGEVRKPPGLWVCEGCTHLIRTLRDAPRSPRDPDDIDTDSEDHPLDGLRYWLQQFRPAPAPTERKPWPKSLSKRPTIPTAGLRELYSRLGNADGW